MTRREDLLYFYSILTFIKRYEGSYTYYNEIKSWTQLSPELSRCLTIEELRKAMKRDKRFYKRDFRKLDLAIDYFLECKGHSVRS